MNIAGNETRLAPAATSPRTRSPTLTPTARTGEYLTDRLADRGDGFIEANKDRPFFLYLPHYAVHTPLQAQAGADRQVQGQGRAGRPRSTTRSTRRWSRAWTRPSAGCMAKLDDLRIADRRSSSSRPTTAA